MQNLPWYIALLLTVLIVAFLVVGAIVGFEEIITYGITALIGVFIGLVSPQLKISKNGEPSSPDSTQQ